MMNWLKTVKTILLLVSMSMFTVKMHAQTLSIDGAVVRNPSNNLKGINTGLYYHFTRKLSGGLELTRFFSRALVVKPDRIERSAWDVDLNIHYDIARFWKIDLYPIVGIGYNEQREKNAQLHRSFYDRYWALNTGAGIRLDAVLLKPHAEYTAIWAGKFEHLLLAGITYEFGKKNP